MIRTILVYLEMIRKLDVSDAAKNSFKRFSLCQFVG